MTLEEQEDVVMNLFWGSIIMQVSKVDAIIFNNI